jgi:hypothetical protein
MSVIFYAHVSKKYQRIGGYVTKIKVNLDKITQHIGHTYSLLSYSFAVFQG